MQQAEHRWRQRIGLAIGAAATAALLAGSVLVGFERQAEASSHRHEMHDGIRAATQSHIDGDGVIKRALRDDL